MIAFNKEAANFSKKGEEGLRTIHCLRGRLLAERHASKVAKQDAELMAKKVIEMENKLREETKLKDRAEERLKFLKKKLESLKISPIMDQTHIVFTENLNRNAEEITKD